MTSSRLRRILPRAAAVALTFGVLVGCTTAPPVSMPTPDATVFDEDGRIPGAVSPEEAGKQLEKRILQDGLLDVLEDDDIPGNVGGLSEVLGKEQAESAFRWAVAVARTGMYVNTLWTSPRENPLPYGAEILAFAQFMDKKRSDEWAEMIASEETIERNLDSITALVTIPEKLPVGATWFSPAVRDWRFVLTSARASAENEDGIRNLEIRFSGTGTAGYTYEGKFYQFTVERNFTFVVRPSPEASKEWELVSWTTSPLATSDVVESLEQPRDVLIPEPQVPTVTEGTSRPDPNYPDIDLPRRGNN